MSLRTTVLAQQSQIRELQSADRRRQTVITEMLAADHRRQKQLTEALKLIKRLQTQMAMINQGVTATLAARDANTNGVDSHNSGTGARRNERATRECTHPTHHSHITQIQKCQPLNFKGTEGVVELTQWIEKMETVFRISNYSVENQIKFSTCTLLGNALTWWNSHVRTVGNDIAYAMTWTELKKKITDKYCPRTEIKKLEVELWELKVKGTDVIGYNQRFQELALLCGRMFPEESDKIEKYVGGLPDMIHGSVVASKPKTMQEATEMAIEVMDKRIRTFTDRRTKKKRKPDNNQQPQQHYQNKRQNTGRAYVAGTVEKKQYGGSKPLCSKCNYHHDGPCAPKCHKCNKVGPFAHDCRSMANANNANHQRGTGSGQKPTCFECRVQGHFKRECSKLKNNNNHGILETTSSLPSFHIRSQEELAHRAKVIENQIMAASAIIISSDSSDEKTSTIAPVISFAAPMVETTLVTSPTGLCGLVPYTSSDSDSPDEMTFYVATVARWRSRVTAHPSSLSEFPIAPVTTPPEIRRRSTILIRPGKAILFGRPYRTHLNGPRKLLIERKRVRPLPARRLASRHASPRSSDHHSSSSSSSSDSSPVHSLGLDVSDQAHSGSSTRDVSPRLCYPPRRAPRRSEAFRRWCAAPLSTLYPPTTSESSSGDSSEGPMHSSPHSAGPSRISDGDEVGDHVEIDHRDARDDTEEYEADASAGDTAEVGIDPMTAPLVEEEIVEPAGEDSPDSSGTRDGIVRIVGIETAQRRLEADQLIASGDRARMAEMIYSLRLENLKVRAMLDIERDRVSSLRLHMSLSQEEFRQIRRDRDDARGRLRRLELYLGRRFGFRP
ncbi:reverse transcriptase domain-containing protein [Tanacetum coccineum]|uniref:Reverse transcriptase domain-containing protein n=1 Tax=Tanacetum coccineum TaxID=301880 RepID=A0ABQ4Y4C8_9ASTR